jgi:GT2 family glycosyltransferase
MINHDNSLFDAISCVLSPMVESCPNWQEHTDGWFNHYVYRPKNYHWISAIHSSNLHKLNGFDERYADGLQFDDDEFLRRIARLGLDIRMVIEPSLFGVHQYHGEQPFPDDDPRIIRNYLLFQSTTHETNYQAIGNKYFNTRE